MQTLQSKIEAIAEKYAELVEKKLIASLLENEVDSVAMCEINDGIRMLNHVASTLERIDRLNRSNDTDGQFN